MTGPTELGMLWERVDPRTALFERFGFGDVAAAVDWVGDVLSGHWDIEVDGCNRLVISAANLLAWVSSGDQQLIAKWSVNQLLFACLAETAALSAWVRAAGLPAAAPIPTRHGHLQLEVGNVSLGVYPVHAGVLLDTSDPSHVTEAGRLLARLQAVLAAYPCRIDGSDPEPGRQLVHNDFRAANLLHDGTRITAVLDFEEATYRNRIADLAKTAVLLSTRYHHWAPTSAEVRAAFIEAYAELAPLADSEWDKLEASMAATVAAVRWPSD